MVVCCTHQKTHISSDWLPCPLSGNNPAMGNHTLNRICKVKTKYSVLPAEQRKHNIKEMKLIFKTAIAQIRKKARAIHTTFSNCIHWTTLISIKLWFHLTKCIHYKLYKQKSWHKNINKCYQSLIEWSIAKGPYLSFLHNLTSRMMGNIIFKMTNN